MHSEKNVQLLRPAQQICPQYNTQFLVSVQERTNLTMQIRFDIDVHRSCVKQIPEEKTNKLETQTHQNFVSEQLSVDYN